MLLEHVIEQFLSILAAAVVVYIYIEYRELGVSRTLQDISAASNNRPKGVAQDYRLKAISKRESLASSNLRKVE